MGGTFLIGTSVWHSNTGLLHTRSPPIYPHTQAATPARRSARKLGRQAEGEDAHRASELALVSTDFAYVPNPALAEPTGPAASPLVAQDSSPALSDRTPLGHANRAVTRSASKQRSSQVAGETPTPAGRPRAAAAKAKAAPTPGMSPTEQGIRRSLRKSQSTLSRRE